MTYTLPVWQEWLIVGTLMAAGAVCLRVGMAAGRGPARVRNVAAAAGAGVAVGSAAAHYAPLRDVAGPWLLLPGGEGSLACLGTLLLLGIAGSDPRRQSSRLIPTAATAVVFLLLLTLGGSSLGWHYFGQRLRANVPDASGALQQTTGITCAPAAAAILLHRAGIRVSEGELAELANTTPLQGTAPHALARAVDRVARCRGLRGRIRRVDYSSAVRLGRPFVAFVRRPGVGGHAVCVLSANPNRVATIDPLSGTQETISREQFAAEWDPVIVWVE
jgi:hypothetical protein